MPPFAVSDLTAAAAADTTTTTATTTTTTTTADTTATMGAVINDTSDPVEESGNFRTQI